MNFKKTMLASLLMISASGAFAADLNITGKVAPAGCDVTFTGAGGTLDFSPIVLNTDPTRGTPLEKKSTGFNVTCTSGPALVGVSLVDTKAETGPNNAVSFGLGLQEGTTNKIGGYMVGIDGASFQADSGAGLVVVDAISRKNGNAWNKVDGTIAGGTFRPDGSVELTAAPTGTVVPVRYQTITGVIDIHPTINPSNFFDANEEIELNGLSTLNVVML